jgi:hypothetical protein
VPAAGLLQPLVALGRHACLTPVVSTVCGSMQTQAFTCHACSRQKRRPTILNAEGAISWPTLGGDAAQDDTAGAARPKPLTFPQEMGRFADKASPTSCSCIHYTST